jgi:hypothetical protein
MHAYKVIQTFFRFRSGIDAKRDEVSVPGVFVLSENESLKLDLDGTVEREHDFKADGHSTKVTPEREEFRRLEKFRKLDISLVCDKKRFNFDELDKYTKYFIIANMNFDISGQTDIIFPKEMFQIKKMDKYWYKMFEEVIRLMFEVPNCLYNEDGAQSCLKTFKDDELENLPRINGSEPELQVLTQDVTPDFEQTFTYTSRAVVHTMDFGAFNQYEGYLKVYSDQYLNLKIEPKTTLFWTSNVLYTHTCPFWLYAPLRLRQQKDDQYPTHRFEILVPKQTRCLPTNYETTDLGAAKYNCHVTIVLPPGKLIVSKVEKAKRTYYYDHQTSKSGEEEEFTVVHATYVNTM